MFRGRGSLLLPCGRSVVHLEHGELLVFVRVAQEGLETVARLLEEAPQEGRNYLAQDGVYEAEDEVPYLVLEILRAGLEDPNAQTYFYQVGYGYND